MNIVLPTGIAHFDGGRRHSTAAAGCAAVVYYDGIGHQRARFLGDQTSNVAEYEGLILALRVALELRITHLKVRGDSLLVVEQVLGAWKTKKSHLQPYVDQARMLAARFEKIEIKHIPREQNAVADALTTQLLDEHTGRRRDAPRSLSFVS